MAHIVASDSRGLWLHNYIQTQQPFKVNTETPEIRHILIPGGNLQTFQAAIAEHQHNPPAPHTSITVIAGICNLTEKIHRECGEEFKYIYAPPPKLGLS